MASLFNSGPWNTSSSTTAPEDLRTTTDLPAGTGFYSSRPDATSAGPAANAAETTRPVATTSAYSNIPTAASVSLLPSLTTSMPHNPSTSTIWTTVLALVTRTTTLPPITTLTFVQNATITQFTTVTATQTWSNSTSLRQRRRIRQLEPRASVTWLPNTRTGMELNKRSFITTQPVITKLNCAHLEHAKVALNTTLVTAIKQPKRDPHQNILPSAIANSTSTATPAISSASARPASLCRLAESQQIATDIPSDPKDFSSILSQLQNTQQTVRSELTGSMATATTTMFGSTTILLVVTETAQVMAPSTSVAGVVEDTVAAPVTASKTTSSADADTSTSSRKAESTSIADETGDAGTTSGLSTATTAAAQSNAASSLLSTSEQTGATSSSFVTSRTILPTSSTPAPSSIVSSNFNTTTATEVNSTPSGLPKSAASGLPAWAIAVIAAVPTAILIIAGICLFLKWRQRRERRNGRARADLPIHLQPIPHNPYQAEPTLPSVHDRGPDYPYIGARRAPILPDRGPEHAYAMAAKSLSATNSNASSTRPRNVSPLPAALNSRSAPRTTLYPNDSASQISRPTSPVRPSVIISPPLPAVPELSALKDYNNLYKVGVHELDGGDKVSRVDYGASQDARRRSAVSALSTVFPTSVPRESYFATDTVLSDDPFKRRGR